MPQDDTSLHGIAAPVSPPPRTEGAAASADSDADKTSAGLSQIDLIATAYSPATPIEQGAWIAGRYRLIQALGEGGMGTVWLAEQREPVRRMVALKVIKPGMDSKAVLARFEAERQALAMMDHPNIAHVLDGGTVQGEMGLASVGTPRPFFVMELVKGLPLLAWCDEKKLPIRERLKLFIQVCAAVQHAHQKGILHRDLKPSNVLVMEQDGQPVPKVIDFGLAKAVHGPQLLTDKTLQTAFGAMIGTPLYMAPEQLGGKTQDVDTRADAYSLGVILYELLTGTTPIETSRLKDLDWDQTRQLIRDEEPPLASQRVAKHADSARLSALRATEPAALVKQLRGDLDWIAAKALDKDRDRRYETVNGLAMDVQRHLADEPVLASPPSVTYRFGKFARKNRVMLTAAATVFLALVAGVVGTALGLVEARHQRDEANLARQDEAKQRAHAEANEKKARAAAEAEREAKEHADQQRAVADAVNSFLHHDLLGQAYVGNQAGGAGLAERNPNITVRELLDRAERTIEGKFGDQPIIEAAVRQSLGDTYWALGEYAIALPHTQRAMQLRSEGHGPRHPATLRSKNNLALLHQAVGNYAEAEKLFREVHDANSARLGDDHPEVLTTQANLAGLFVALGRFAEAEPLLQRVVTARAGQLGPDHADTLVAKSALAQLYHDQGRFAKAEPLILEVIQLSTEKQGADHPTTLAARHDLAQLYHAQRDYARAEPAYRQVLADFTAKLGPRHVATLQAQNNLALLFRDLGRFSEAESLHRQVLATCTEKLGADHPETLTFKNNLAVLYHDLQRYGDAEPLLRAVLQARLAKLGKEHPHTLVSHNNLARLEQAQMQVTPAEANYRAAYTGSLAKLGPDHPSTLLYASNLAQLLEDDHRPQAAEPLRRGLVQAQLRREGASSLATASAQAALGLNLLMQRKYADAEPIIRASLNLRTAQIPDDWRTFYGRSMLGEAAAGQGKTDEALPLLRESFAGLLARLDAIPPAFRASRLAEAALRLAAALERAGQTAEAVQWRDRLWAIVSAP